ncbi:SwmB domain-containing protein [Porphyrobacter sp. ULC335]|uniref:SwmB domain-containing protein n=1 Tax=Porphyrobacter sp. ULC335 TaxID=2854260 RepID=UPI00221E9C55|nr:SwmB domain-containing protein [Porphyrobacter sp. ULC335]UYV15860.1 hypothetical protein KVF90_00445 [Porphyrobacter sp. ULC335]
MARFGFGYGRAPRQRKVDDGASLASQVSRSGVTFTFGSPRPAGQYANGDWWVLGPVTITAISPASTLHNGTSGLLTGSGNTTPPYTGRVVHGTMINPGNRSFASGGNLANNSTNTLQGWDSLGLGGLPSPVYSAPSNVDPGATGTALAVTSGSVVKFVSRLTDLPINNRPAGNDMVVLTVVSDVPAPDAIRPGVSRQSKATQVRASDFDVSVFKNFAPTANTPTYGQAISWVSRYHETSMPDSINNTRTKGINNHPEYGRDIARNLHSALLCLHLSSFTATQKREILTALAAIADDLVSRAEEGSITLGAGGGNSWKVPIIVVCAAALGTRAPASWLAQLAPDKRSIWAENSQIFRVSGYDIALPRFTADGRPRSAYTQQMIGSAEWGEQQMTAPQNSGSNWDALYRDIVNYSLIGGTLAVELTTGAKALWDYPEFWLYMDTVYGRRTEGGAGNTVLPFVQEMLTAYRVPKLAAPAIVEAGVKNAAVWIRFDQALNESVSPPAAADFVVKVNGAPVTVSNASVWRQNAGLTLAAAVTGNDTVTVSYTSGTNKLRSVDNVNVASFVDRASSNATDRVGGPNPAYPVVRFTPGVRRTIGGTRRLAEANSAVCTAALLKFRFPALPSAATRIFGFTAGAPALSLFLNANGSIEMRLLNGSAAIVTRPTTPALLPNTEYDILWSVDLSRATAAIGHDCYINGQPQTLTNFSWVVGGSIGWTNVGDYQWNHNNNATFDMGAFWLDTSARLDLSNAANRAKFTNVITGDLAILTLGNGVTGSRPTLFHVGDAEQWNESSGINRGTGNRFFVTEGTVAQVSGSKWV